MTGEYIEVAIEIAHVDGHVHGGLTAVDEHGNAALMSDSYHLLDRDHRAEHVRHVGDGNHLRARRQKRFELLDQELAVVSDRRPFDDRSSAVIVPRHDVRMVLHNRQDDLIALADDKPAARLRHEVDRHRRVTREDDLVA